MCTYNQLCIYCIPTTSYVYCITSNGQCILYTYTTKYEKCIPKQCSQHSIPSAPYLYYFCSNLFYPFFVFLSIYLLQIYLSINLSIYLSERIGRGTDILSSVKHNCRNIFRCTIYNIFSLKEYFYLYIYPTVYLSIYLYIYPTVYLSIYLSNYLFIYLSII